MTEAEKHAEDTGGQPERRSDHERDDASSSSHEKPNDDKGDNGSPASADRTDAGAKRRPRGSGPMAGLAMLVALASLGLASYPFWSQWLNPDSAEPTAPTASEFDRLAGRVDSIRQETTAAIERLRDDLDRLSSEVRSEDPGPDVGALSERLDQLSTRIERLQGERNTDLSGMRGRLEEIESEVGRRLEQFELKLSNVGSNLDRADQDLATRLLLMEVDSLFAIAQNNLVVSESTGVALQAWERAMARLTALDGAKFEDLKETARREFTRLQEYRSPDVGRQIERLFTLADQVTEWPVKTAQPGTPAADTGSDEGWRARLGQVVGSLVRVESVDREFLGPDEIDRARAQVRSLLQTAALAMVRSRPDLARDLIGEAGDAVQRVFDTESENVSAALDRLDEIAAEAAGTAPPELTESRTEISRLLGEIR